MGEAELLDIFPDGFEDKAHAKSDYDESYAMGRSKMNDYKHTSNINKSHDYPSSTTQTKKTFINVSDERIVWAGAIFVFFGVFVFLIGYWLGKNIQKDVALNNKQTLQSVEEKLTDKKLENSFLFTPTPATKDATKPEAPISPPISVEEKREPISIKEEAPAPIQRDSTIQESVSSMPPINIQSQPKVETKQVKLQKPASIKKSSEIQPKPIKTVAGTPGNYTIQVSAYTSMDKARVIEDYLRKMNLQAYLVEANVNGITYYRVRVGKFSTKEEAQKTLESIKKRDFGKDSIILNLN